VILLDKTYDFTDLEVSTHPDQNENDSMTSGLQGSETGKVCKPWTCSPGAQVAIDVNGWCGREQKNAKTVSFSTAAFCCHSKPMLLYIRILLRGKRRA
jgi:hypothetical protein